MRAKIKLSKEDQKIRDNILLIKALLKEFSGSTAMGDWINNYDLLMNGVKKFKTADKFMDDLRWRSDISEDQKDIFESYEVCIQTLFIMCGKKIK